MNFSMIILTQNIKTMQNYVTRILTALLFLLKLKIFTKTLEMKLKNYLIHQIIKLIDHYLKERIRK